MKKFRIIAILLVVLLVPILVLKLTGCENTEEDGKDKIVTSFYPMYIIALNLTDQISDVAVNNMTNNAVGCVHNYTLQTADLKKLEKASVFIRNGLGLESFMDKITTTYPNLKLIDSSEANLDILHDEDEENGHAWTSRENYKKQVLYVAQKLGEIYPENREKYVYNANEYIGKINLLNGFVADKEIYVISCNEALAYMLEEAKLKVLPVYTEHDESSLSGGKLAEVIKLAKENNVEVIFIDKNDDEKNAQLIAKETGAKIVQLDSCLSGIDNKDAYINAMENNYRVMRDIFNK